MHSSSDSWSFLSITVLEAVPLGLKKLLITVKATQEAYQTQTQCFQVSPSNFKNLVSPSNCPHTDLNMQCNGMVDSEFDEIVALTVVFEKIAKIFLIGRSLLA